MDATATVDQIGRIELDRLAVGQRDAEGDALPGVGRHHLERAAAHADAARAHLQPPHVEAELHRRVALADGPELLGTPDHPVMGIYRSNYGRVLGRAGKREEALAAFAAAQPILDAKLGPEHDRSKRNRDYANKVRAGEKLE